MPINASHEYFEAEKKYLAAQTTDEKIACLQDLIRAAPKHKGSENLLAELKLRLKKLKEKSEKIKKSGKGKKGIRKEGFQVVLIGKVNSGKSSLLSALTNASPLVSSVGFSTNEPELGTMEYEGVKAQVVDLPAIDGKEFDSGIVNGADCLLIVVDRFDDFFALRDMFLEKRKKVFVFNKIDLLNVGEKRKLEERCKAKRLDYVLVSSKNAEGINELKEKIFLKMKVIRVYTKEPGKTVSKDPVVLSEGASVRDVGESIYKGFMKEVKEIRVTGPSAKFSNQKVGIKHVLKDRDVVEFKT